MLIPFFLSCTGLFFFGAGIWDKLFQVIPQFVTEFLEYETDYNVQKLFCNSVVCFECVHRDLGVEHIDD